MDAVVNEIVTDPVHETHCLKCQHLMDVSGLPAFVQIACPECGTQQHVPAKMGAFLLVDLLGKGGMGAVYRGRDTGLDRWVAVKVMQASFGGNPAFVETFRREAQAAAALNHPNIVQIYSFGVAHGQPYMVMELLEGGRLDHMIAKGELLNEAVVLKIAVDVAEGLNAAAAINLIHGDVKPENILLDANGVAKVVDFGLARFKETGSGGTSQGIWGTPYYIAPEKLRGHPSDARSDIYSLGGTLFHALTLKPPFDGETPIDVVKARLKAPAPPLRQLRPGINPELEMIVARMLEVDPARRYPSYASALSDMRRAFSALKPPPSPGVSPTLKKGGKIILTKKKEGSGLTLSAPLATPPPEPAESPEPAAVAPKRNWRKPVLLSLLGVVLLTGLVAGGLAWRKASKLKEAASRELAQTDRYRRNAAKVESDVNAALADLEQRAAQASTLASNALRIATAITEGVGKTSDPTVYTAVQSNAQACAAVADQYCSATLAPAMGELKDMAALAGASVLAMKSMTNAAPALEKYAALTNMPVRTLELQEQVAAAERRSRQALETLAGLREKMESVLKEADAAAAREAAEKAEADRIAAEKAAVEAKEAEKAAKIQGEIKSLEDVRKANVSLIQRHQFDQLREAIEQVAKGLKTPEGRTAGRHTLRAYQTLVDLKRIFIEGIKAEVKDNPDRGYSYGWLKETDILGADAFKLTIRGGQKISWDDVPAREIIILYQHYVENGTLSHREKGESAFALALYIHDTMGGNENARKQIPRYLAPAIGMVPSLDDVAKVVMPGVETR